MRVGERGWLRLVAAGFGVLLALAGLAVALIAPGTVGGLGLFAGLSWTALMLAAFWATVGFEVGDERLVVRRGWERLELGWADVEAVELGLAGELRFALTAPARERLRLPGDLRVRAPYGVSAAELEALARERWAAARGGKAPARLAVREGSGPARPRGGDGSRSAVETAADGSVRLRVLVANEDLGPAAVELALLIVAEHRWNPAFTGQVELQLSRLETPPSPALTLRMDEVAKETRAELARRRWCAPGGTAITVAWSR